METIQSKTVLYVDDENINLQLFYANFKRFFNVITALSPNEAITVIQSKPVDLVITDFKMPVMNGIDFIKEIKKTHPSLKCIVLSGYIESQIIDEKEKQMVYEYIMKPWKRDDLLNVLSKALA